MGKPLFDFTTYTPNYDLLRPEYNKLTSTELKNIGDAESLFQLGIRKNRLEWVKRYQYFISAALCRHPLALAHVLDNETCSVHLDRDHSIEILHECAHRGHAHAMFILGFTSEWRMYYWGFSLPIEASEERSLYWNRLACLNDHVEALYELAYFYAKPKVVERCFPVAIAILNIYIRKGGVHVCFMDYNPNLPQESRGTNGSNWNCIDKIHDQVSKKDRLLGNLLTHDDHICDYDCQTATELLCEKHPDEVQLISQNHASHKTIIDLITQLLPQPICEEMIPSIVVSGCIPANVEEFSPNKRRRVIE
jgi:TPR repeat protein